MTTYYLVRHAQADRTSDPIDPALSAQGRLEAERVATFLRPFAIDRIYASPLRRAQETAAISAAAVGLLVTTEPRLRERMNFGDIPGQTFEEFVALWERCNRERDFVPPVGDSSRNAGRKIEAFIAETSSQLPTGSIAAITHGGVIADFLLNVCTPERLLELSPAFAAQPYAASVMRNGAITTVDFDATHSDRAFVIKAIAQADHLLSIST